MLRRQRGHHAVLRRADHQRPASAQLGRLLLQRGALFRHRSERRRSARGQRYELAIERCNLAINACARALQRLRPRAQIKHFFLFTLRTHARHKSLRGQRLEARRILFAVSQSRLRRREFAFDLRALSLQASASFV